MPVTKRRSPRTLRIRGHTIGRPPKGMLSVKMHSKNSGALKREYIPSWQFHALSASDPLLKRDFARAECMQKFKVNLKGEKLELLPGAHLIGVMVKDNIIKAQHLEIKGLYVKLDSPIEIDNTEAILQPIAVICSKGTKSKKKLPN